MEDSYAIWFGIAGMVTGFAGLVLHFWRYLQEKPRINLYFPSGQKGKLLLGAVHDWEHRNSLGEPTKDSSRCTYYIWTRISNQSDKPITILEFKLLLRTQAPYVLDSDSTCEGYIPLTEGSSRSMRPLTQPILTIEPYSAVEGYLFFGPASFIPADGSKATLAVKTTRKTFKHSIRIYVDRTNQQRFDIRR